jgi:NNP family nitrate/nitrite transporter-like MFS transporter
MLLFLLVAACLAWMHLAIRRMEKGSEASAEPLTQAAQ